MELFINDFLVDLDKSIPFPLTFQIYDIRNMNERRGNRSKTIKLPGTRRNHNHLSSVFMMSTTTAENTSDLNMFDPSIKATARAYENGILQFEGIAQLIDCTRLNGIWSFNVVLFSEQIDIMTLLKNYKIKELGWDEYNHTLTEANQVDTWSGTIQKNGVPYSNTIGSNWLGEGYYYGLTDYGYDRLSANSFRVEELPPQIFLKTIVDKMFSAIGYTYNSDYFNSQLFKRQLLAWGGGNFPSITQADADNLSIETDQINQDGLYFFNSVQWGSFNILTIPDLRAFNSGSRRQFIHVDTGTDIDPSGLIQNHTPIKVVPSTPGIYSINYKGTHDVNWTTTLTGATGATVMNLNHICRLEIWRNGALWVSPELWNNQIVNDSALSGSYSASFDYTQDIAVSSSDVIEVAISIYHTNATVQNATMTDASLDVNITATTCELDLEFQLQQIAAGSLINIRNFLPDMDCATFFKGLITQARLQLEPNKDDNTILNIEPELDFFQGTNSVLDWTHLIDHSKEYKVTPTINFAPKEFKFTFENDLDYWNNRYLIDTSKQYGSKTNVSPSQFATGETKFKLPFATKLLGQIPTTDLIVPRNFQVKTDENGVSDIVERKGKSFIVQLKNDTIGTLQSGAWNHINESSVLTSRTEYPYVGHVDNLDSPSFDLSFEVPDFVFYDLPAGVNYPTNNLYVYHEKFIREMFDRHGKLLSCYIKLTPDIINTLDFSKLINISGVIYRLQKVVDYDSQNMESTRCELLRVMEADSIQTYTILVQDDKYETPTVKNRKITESGDQKITESGSDKYIE